MPKHRIMIDGLRRCLCPSIDLILASKAPKQVTLSTRHQTLHSRPTICKAVPHSAQRQARRPYNDAAAEAYTSWAFLFGPDPREETNKRRAEYLTRLLKRSAWVPGAIVEGTDPLQTKLSRIPTNDIYLALKELGEAQDTYFATTKLVEYLIKERGERPNLTLYQSLIKANADTRYGSATVASNLFKEVLSLGIETTPDFYYTLLEVIAVHPDYVLRSTILHEMKIRWFTLTPSAQVNLILSLLREKEYELAFAKFAQLAEIPLNVPPWLFDVFLYTFGERGYHEEALAILKRRQRIEHITKQKPLSLNTWLYLLDVFGRDHFYPGIKYVWGQVVAQGNIHPPDGVMLNVLNAVSLRGDTSLAMNIIGALSDRGVVLGMHHYEALIHSHMQHEDVQKAFTVLCIMARAGHPPDLSSTRPIFQSLRNSPEQTDEAVHVLHQLGEAHPIPTAAFNVVLEATSMTHPHPAALDLYRGIRQICKQGPDVETFEVLFAVCKSAAETHFLIAEMDTFGLRPTQRILDYVILNFSLQQNHEPAFTYLESVKKHISYNQSEPLWLSKTSALALLRKCWEDKDPRFGEILEECNRRGIQLGKHLEMLIKGIEVSLPASVISGPVEGDESAS